MVKIEKMSVSEHRERLAEKRRGAIQLISQEVAKGRVLRHLGQRATITKEIPEQGLLVINYGPSPENQVRNCLVSPLSYLLTLEEN